ncbi:maleylpyruvate isomerase N-terminal domain-containing protein [Cellulomonas wangsupingiae]|uniref:Maleylpyruvate isomerase N-terminal domain-containing protein n=1 Tax=Cellulomonas wangsupingiae TaxID=2968085 RepID=A0ABY5K4A1_9CELL|nr:maleylpyruvate isomerase N-terminal domain-containing protein [Cellulomonas wangsupingiae]MCC2333908.1 maleylpyruvate isomerase N-terminal domain-containing protein [Cellulomonas wangsupingiae]UUI65165.1 maleylpyruvate isomerase N-terminal domain-containing protein [Cellulomonas wangsupingiae]
MKPTVTIDACATSHQLLLAGLAPLDDGDFRAPCLLPTYSRGHLVTHVANKARAHVRIFEGAAVGEVRRIHPDGYDPDQAAGAGATRPATELRADLADCLQLLEGAWAALDDEQWAARGIMAAGPRTMVEIIGHHLRNIEVHHVDLDIGHRPSDWPALLVETELPKRLRALPDRASRAGLLAWLIGRGPAPDLLGEW